MPVPVLPATCQSAGTPARSRRAPVVLAAIQRSSCARESARSPSPSSSVCRPVSIAAGVVVSRGSPGRFSFRVGSTRSSRVARSPSPRANAVSAGGPPKLDSSRLPAVLSLTTTAASHSSDRVMPGGPVRDPVTGEYGTRSPPPITMRRSSRSSP